MDYKEILEEQLQLLREIAQKRKYSLSEYCEISKNMVEIVNCLNSLWADMGSCRPRATDVIDLKSHHQLRSEWFGMR